MQDVKQLVYIRSVDHYLMQILSDSINICYLLYSIAVGIS